MNNFLIILAIMLPIIALDVWLDRRFSCSCGRHREWYFGVQHERAGVMMGRAIWNSFCAVLLLFAISWIMGPLVALFATWAWRKWWFHEKDKLKKKAAKLAGIVSFNQHGKLVVVNEK